MSLTTVFKRRIHLSDPEKQALGEQALFVFDTNVLLSLYRVAPKTRAEAFRLLKQLKGRAWIPHHVGVEFFRNRSQYLDEDATRYDVSRKRVEDAFQELLDEISEAEFDKLGSMLDVEKLRAQLNDIRDKLVDELKAVAERYTAMKEKDEVLALLDDIFEGSVGEPLASQPELEKLYCEGEERYKRKQPPGYKDGDKLGGEFWQDGLVYKRKFGDLIVWKQLLLAAEREPKRFSHVVFVTQDQKPRNPGHLRKLVTKNLAAARGRLASLTGLRPQVDKLTFIVVLQPLAVANSPAPQWIAAFNRAKDFCSRELAIDVVSGLLDGDIFAPLA